MNAVICELNPLHRGHEFIINEAGKYGETVLIMSGNFTQRGSAAVFDKYERARAAVLCGADLVLELPFPWCSAGASEFAAGGVFIASSIGAKRLVFGSGTGDGDAMRQAGEAFAGVGGGADFDQLLAAASRDDPSAGAAELRERILSQLLTPERAKALSNPNDILGIEYNRAAAILGGIECVPVLRREGEGVTSATSIRRMIYEGDVQSIAGYIPRAAADVFLPLAEKGFFADEESFWTAVRGFFRMDMYQRDGAECGGGVGDRLRRAAGESLSGAEMKTLASTKKYTDARLRRAALFAVTGIRWEHIKERPLYTTVLAIGRRGRDILKRLKKSCGISVLTKAADHDKLPEGARAQFLRSTAADRFYTVVSSAPMREEHFLGITPFVLK